MGYFVGMNDRQIYVDDNGDKWSGEPNKGGKRLNNETLQILGSVRVHTEPAKAAPSKPGKVSPEESKREEPPLWELEPQSSQPVKKTVQAKPKAKK